jgi:hypothetical protein
MLAWPVSKPTSSARQVGAQGALHPSRQCQLRQTQLVGKAKTTTADVLMKSDLWQQLV